MAEYIEREAVLKKLTPYTKDWYDVQLIPIADVAEVKHARWKKAKKEKMYCDWEMNGWFDYPETCTNCGYDATEYGFGVGNYCPNCGAKMDGKGGGNG